MPKRYTKKRYTTKRTTTVRASRALTVRKYNRANPATELKRGGVTVGWRQAHSNRFGAVSQSVQTGRLPFTTTAFYKLPFSESFAISADGNTGVASTFYTYRLNSPFDPRAELGGGQPIQWDQVNPMYERYQVWGAKFTVTFSNPLYDGALVGFRVRSLVNPVTTAGRTVADLKQMELTKSRWIHNTGNQTTSFTVYIKPWEIFGITKTQYVNLEYSSPDTQNPAVILVAEPFLLHSVASETNTIRCTVRITYYFQMMQKITVLDV